MFKFRSLYEWKIWHFFTTVSPVTIKTCTLKTIAEEKNKTDNFRSTQSPELNLVNLTLFWANLLAMSLWSDSSKDYKRAKTTIITFWEKPYFKWSEMNSRCWTPISNQQVASFNMYATNKMSNRCVKNLMMERKIAPLTLPAKYSTRCVLTRVTTNCFQNWSEETRLGWFT